MKEKPGGDKKPKGSSIGPEETKNISTTTIVAAGNIDDETESPSRRTKPNQSSSELRVAKRVAEGLRPIKTVQAGGTSSEISLPESSPEPKIQRRRRLSDELSTSESSSVVSGGKRTTRQANKKPEPRRTNRVHKLMRPNMIDPASEDDDDGRIVQPNIDDTDDDHIGSFKKSQLIIIS